MLHGQQVRAGRAARSFHQRAAAVAALRARTFADSERPTLGPHLLTVESEKLSEKQSLADAWPLRNDRPRPTVPAPKADSTEVCDDGVPRRVKVRALFLDFDGVLHPTPLSDADQPLRLLPHLRDALLGKNVALVVHSTWRYAYRPRELRELLATAGVPVLGATPYGPRYESILSWLDINPQVTDHRILDDDASEFPTPPPMELILCDPADGLLTAGVLNQLACWLENREKTR